MNLLIIEDNLSIARMVKIFLEQKNFNVEIASTGNQGFEKARQKNMTSSCSILCCREKMVLKSSHLFVLWA